MNNEISVSDQWKLSGDCKLCRRAKYCNKGCKASKGRLQAMFYNEVIKRCPPVTEILNRQR